MATAPIKARKTRFLDRVLIPLPGIVGVLGFLVILGWITRSPVLMQVLPSWVPMQFNTALLFILTASATTLAFIPYSPRATRALCLIVGLFSAATLTQYLTGASFGIDELFIHAHTTVQTSHPGRMAPNTALSFLACAGAIISLTRSRKSLKYSVVGSTLVLSISLLALYGYVTNTESAYGWGNYTRMAVHTSVCFFLLSTALLLECWFRERCCDSTANRLPDWIPFITASVVLTFGLCAWNTTSFLERNRLEEQTRMNALSLQRQLTLGIQGNVDALDRMAKRYENGVRGSNWVTDARNYIASTPGLFGIGFFTSRYSEPRLIVPNSARKSRIREFSPTVISEGGVSVPSVYSISLRNSQSFAISIPVSSPDSDELLGIMTGFYDASAYLDYVLGADGDRGDYTLFAENGTVLSTSLPENAVSPETRQVTLMSTLPPWKITVYENGAASLTEVGLSLSTLALAVALLITGLTFWIATFACRNYNLEQDRTDTEIREANSELESLLYTIAHDLKEPLRSINSFCAILADECDDCLSEDARFALDRVTQGGTRMENLLRDVAVMSKLHTMEVKGDSVSLNKVVARQIKFLKEKIESTGATITVAENLPCLPLEDKWVGRAIHHMIGNSLKFAKEGEAPSISIVSYHGKEGSGIIVKDRGTGLGAAESERLFDLFRRGVGNKVEGTGAGLAIVRKVAHKHGGKAWFRSRAGGGAEFYLTLSACLQ